MSDTGSDDTTFFNAATRDAWNTNSDHWDSRMAEGNDWHKLLIEPNQLKLLDLKHDELVVDIACGNGQFARKMAELGARVGASDFASNQIEHARERTRENADRIEYSVIDATDRDQLLALGERRFDAAVCTMAIMDIAEIDPLFSSVSRLLKPGGRFVFSVTHPCFNMTGPKMKKVAEQEEIDGEIVTRYSLSITGYLEPTVTGAVAMPGSPVAHYDFHRPISMLLNAGFREGFVVDGFVEPAFDRPMILDRPFSWDNLPHIPPVLVVRMRLTD